MAALGALSGSERNISQPLHEAAAEHRCGSSSFAEVHKIAREVRPNQMNHSWNRAREIIKAALLGHASRVSHHHAPLKSRVFSGAHLLRLKIDRYGIDLYLTQILDHAMHDRRGAQL